MITLDEFARAVPCSTEIAKLWHPLIVAAMSRWEINSRLRAAGFIAQMSAECQRFTRFTENLNYTAQGLADTWPTRFAVNPKASAKFPNAKAWDLGRIDGQKYSNLEGIANEAYGGRFGNRPGTNDGWKYRGRGPKQITFRNNYRLCGVALGLDLVVNPDLLLEPKHGAQSAGWYWQSHHCNELMDANNYLGVTRAINGGTNGLKTRVDNLRRACEVLEIAYTV